MKIIIILLLLFSYQSRALDVEDYVKFSILKGSYQDNKALFAIETKLEKGWKIYNNQIQEIGFPTNIIISKQKNIKNFHIIFPKAKIIEEGGGFISYGYKNHVIFPVTLESVNSNKVISGRC